MGYFENILIICLLALPAACIFSIIHALFTYSLLFFYSYKKYNRNISQFITYKVLIAFGVEAIVYFMNIIIKPCQYLELLPNKKLPDCSAPIILVHGFSQSRAYWLLMRIRLKLRYKGPIYTVNFKDSSKAIEDLASELSSYIKKVILDKKLIIVGHSLGGLVASFYTENLAKQNKLIILKVITIASPFHGTELTKFSSGANIKQMTINSTFLKDLRNQITQSAIPYYHIASKMDNIVIPWESALPKANISKDNYKTLVYPGHQSLLVSPEVLDIVYHWCLLNTSSSSN